ncbi:MAG TPA: acetate--CoA ligase family protein [Acidimicrobiia bacterium]|nr:acetate--CoA ligase family protein [Acidimicrobiia bacterium]
MILPFPSLDPLLAARSVAVVGASPRPGTVGYQVMRQLLGGAYRGRVYPINPNHRQVADLPAFPDLASLDSPPELTVLAVADHRLEEQMKAALAMGSGALAVFSPAWGTAEDGTPLRDRLRDLARAAAVPMCGANAMGFLNLEQQLRVCGFYQPYDLEPGTVTFLSHSGSLFSAMLHNHRRLRFNLVVSSGLELVTTMDQYLAYALSMPTTRVVALFLETIRHVEPMRAALTEAAERDVAVVALKVGRSQRGVEAAATHSGALAGDDEVYRAFFAALGVHQVDSLAELVDTAEIFTGRRARPGGLGSVHDSGGERTLLLDWADTLEVPIASLEPETSRRLAEVLDPGLEPENPVDAWGAGHDANSVFAASLGALGADPEVGLVAFAVDLTAEEDGAAGYVEMLNDVNQSLDPPLVVLANLAAAVDPVQAGLIREREIPVLEGTESGLAAIGHALAHANYPWRRRTLSTLLPPPGWSDRLARGEALFESEALALLADYGISTATTVEASSRDEALKAAASLPGPVTLKAATGLLHKTEAKGVYLGLTTAAAVEAAYLDLAARLGPQVIVQQMTGSGLELALGVVEKGDFGPLVLVGAGGVLVESLTDRAWLMPPFDYADAERALGRLQVAKLLAGMRGSPPLDRSALIEAVLTLGRLATEVGHLISELDLNPLIVTAEGAVAVDALVIPRLHPGFGA